MLRRALLSIKPSKGLGQHAPMTNGAEVLSAYHRAHTQEIEIRVKVLWILIPLMLLRFQMGSVDYWKGIFFSLKWEDYKEKFLFREEMFAFSKGKHFLCFRKKWESNNFYWKHTLYDIEYTPYRPYKALIPCPALSTSSHSVQLYCWLAA